jgi:hypothetical protein
MATLTFAYNHSRDPMNPGDLADKIAAGLSLTSAPQVDVNPTQIVVTHPSITSGNTAAILAMINAYVLDPVRASLPEGNLGTLLVKARQALTSNDAFLALGAPTNAQVLTQVQRLTRESSALIRFALSDTSDTAGT